MTLDAVIIAISGGQPRLLVVDDPQGPPSLPHGALDATEDVTLELGMRRLIREQTGLEVGYIEQLYTFGDRDRGPRRGRGRTISIAYLALVREQEPAHEARWLDFYELLPWEDERDEASRAVAGEVRAALDAWAGSDRRRQERVSLTFGSPWDGIRVLERYELLYGAGMVAERPVSERGRVTYGRPMALDHRRIAATALGRIRGKLTYRPVVFELLPESFRLLELQRTVEALAGVALHKQNFRRLVERTGLVEGTGQRVTGTAGRPAELFRYRPSVQLERPQPGVGLPYR